VSSLPAASAIWPASLPGNRPGSLRAAPIRMGPELGSLVLIVMKCHRLMMSAPRLNTEIAAQGGQVDTLIPFDILSEMLHPNFVILGALIGSIGSIAYLIETVKGKVKPNRVSFLLWSIAPLIAFFAQIQQGVGLEALMTFSTGFLPLTVLIASFVNKQAEWKLTRFDGFCGILSLVGLVLWLITKVGNIAIFFSIVADGLAAVPTVVKSYQYPDTELAWPWLATSFGIVLTLLTLSHWTFANSGFILYILIIDTVIFALVQLRIGERVRGTLPWCH
jgi:hypothetical protein